MFFVFKPQATHKLTLT